MPERVWGTLEDREVLIPLVDRYPLQQPTGCDRGQPLRIIAKEPAVNHEPVAASRPDNPAPPGVVGRGESKLCCVPSPRPH